MCLVVFEVQTCALLFLVTCPVASRECLWFGVGTVSIVWFDMASSFVGIFCSKASSKHSAYADVRQWAIRKLFGKFLSHHDLAQ